jgi:hypothetical protein
LPEISQFVVWWGRRVLTKCKTHSRPWHTRRALHHELLSITTSHSAHWWA